MLPRNSTLFALGAASIVLAALGIGWFLQALPATASEEHARFAAGSDDDPTPASAAVFYEVHIRPGPETPRVLATIPGADGSLTTAMVSCSTCHATRTPDLGTSTAAALDEFHRGLDYRHGDLSCLSCHNAGNYDTLRRADGRSIEFPNTIQLCAQCHGPQYRDYRNGSHGGMTGHWDLRVGERNRNTCVDCHDAHAPAYPRVQPVFAPQDRGARQQRGRTSSHAPEAASNHD